MNAYRGDPDGRAARHQARLRRSPLWPAEQRQPSSACVPGAPCPRAYKKRSSAVERRETRTPIGEGYELVPARGRALEREDGLATPAITLAIATVIAIRPSNRSSSRTTHTLQRPHLT